MRAIILTSILALSYGGQVFAQEPAPENVLTPDRSAPETTSVRQTAVRDPFEGVNRKLYAVHDRLDRAVLEPLARGYRFITPRPVRNRVRNFLRNLDAPATLANDILQGEARRAGATIARFGMNSTVGLLGLFDPAAGVGIEHHSEDFGQTLAVWGVGSGPYLFVPVLGPTNLRDSFGTVIDGFLDPLSWAKFEGETELAMARGVGGALTIREELLEPIDAIRATAIDPYVSFRSLHAQMREADIQNSEGAPEPLPDVSEFPLIDEPSGAPLQSDVEGEPASIAALIAPSPSTFAPSAMSPTAAGELQ